DRRREITASFFNQLLCRLVIVTVYLLCIMQRRKPLCRIRLFSSSGSRASRAAHSHVSFWQSQQQRVGVFVAWSAIWTNQRPRRFRHKASNWSWAILMTGPRWIKPSKELMECTVFRPLWVYRRLKYDRVTIWQMQPRRRVY